MSFLMPKIAAPVAAPRLNTEEDEADRLRREREAIAQQSRGGKRSTIVAGAQIAAEEQYGRALLSQKRRAGMELG